MGANKKTLYDVSSEDDPGLHKYKYAQGTSSRSLAETSAATAIFCGEIAPKMGWGLPSRPQMAYLRPMITRRFVQLLCFNGTTTFLPP